MQSQNRRVFMLHAVAGTTALSLTGRASAQAASEPFKATEAVKETDPYPRSMGFRLNTANVDQVKFPRHTVAQHCSECQLFSGQPGEPTGTCSFFKRLVPPDGWCRNFKPRKAAA